MRRITFALALLLIASPARASAIQIHDYWLACYQCWLANPLPIDGHVQVDLAQDEFSILSFGLAWIDAVDLTDSDGDFTSVAMALTPDAQHIYGPFHIVLPTGVPRAALATPEPSVLALFGIGCAALLGLSRLRKKRATV